MSQMTPREIAHELDRHIVGQNEAKRAVAIALRNRWRRMQLNEELREEVTPKNILMIGPTGVGKTEIARRLATLAKAPFIKIEATKFTEVGYVGKEVESIIRDLADSAVKMYREQAIEKNRFRAEEAAEMAISSPLLEDIDLAGARGVLVNITAGLDMRLDEFETVGNTVKAFASDNATVVIGTSLDPDMTDEIRVTVVATGIGTERKPDITLVAGGKAKVAPTPQPQVAPQAAPKVEEKVAQPLQEKTEVKPQVKPQPTTSPVSSGTGASQSAAPKPEKESGYLDIPAFLRRQAD